MDRYDPVARRFETGDLIYKNSTGTLLHFAEGIRASGLKPCLVSWNIGFTRFASALLDMGLVEKPAYLLLLLTDNTCIAGHPGSPEGLRAHLDFLPEDGVEWTVANFGGNLLPLAETIISRGGHIAIGIGDHAYGELGHPSNAQLIGEVVKIAQKIGREIATPEEAKAILAMK